jgi:AcrR family transcriptional regulator
MVCINNGDVGRPKKQESRRGEMVAAAGRAIMSRGITGLRVKDVAAAAELSAGLVSYYYPSIDDLLIEVHQDALDRFYWARYRAVQDLTDPAARLRETVRRGIPDAADDVVCRVLYELHLHASRSSVHAALMSALFDREVSLYTTAMDIGRASGVFAPSGPPLEIARNAVALEDAYGLHIVGGNRAITPILARNNVLGYLSTALDCELAAFAATGKG